METVPDTEVQPATSTKGETASGQGDTGPQKVNGSNLKSILKVKAEAVIKTRGGEGGPVEGAVSPTSPTDIVPIISQQPQKPPRKKVHGLKTSTTLSYDNPAFENADRNADRSADLSNGEKHLSDVVDKMLDFKQDNHDWHPFGRISMYEEVLSGKSKSGLFESEKVILWFIFIILLVGMAGGIIFLSETYISTKISNQTNETGVDTITM